MNEQKNRAFYARLQYALAGFAIAMRTERSLRTQFVILLAGVGVLLYVRPAPLWWALFILASAGVLAAELFNTALERLADHLHPELHDEIRVVKDCAAAAVLIMALGAVGVALALLYALLA
jgi:undecaprenol kinase